jgi:hypothetical protein
MNCFTFSPKPSNFASESIFFCRRDHPLVGLGDCVDGRGLPGVPLEELVSLRHQFLDAALAVGFRLLFERSYETLNRRPRLVGDPDDLAMRRFSLLLEAAQARVGLSHYGRDLIFGFEYDALCLVCHFTLP